MGGNTPSQPIPRQTGRVKWFNNKSGFGFITLCADESATTATEASSETKDIFVHYSSIVVNKSQYKYLVQGEYVDFELAKPEKGEHEFHAVNVTGVKGGELMCETAKPYVPSNERIVHPKDNNDGFVSVAYRHKTGGRRPPLVRKIQK